MNLHGGHPKEDQWAVWCVCVNAKSSRGGGLAETDPTNDHAAFISRHRQVVGRDRVPGGRNHRCGKEQIELSNEERQQICKQNIHP